MKFNINRLSLAKLCQVLFKKCRAALLSLRLGFNFRISDALVVFRIDYLLLLFQSVHLHRLEICLGVLEGPKSNFCLSSFSGPAVQLRPVNFFSYSPSLPPSPLSFLSLTHTQTHTQAHQTDGTEHVDLTAGNCRA